ncbi:rhodanese-like domain-containing protein [Draconibacterium sp. IB214405]|uniref:rhodanese-like domain-containing protein n=1 Tax=Draconibacterium sp. IB214405 TaxID=3097352 RepID=UPI002A0DC7CA|nr:rhodanese-like domain-containing protein [Draconibacterium sp. IB214405]MDX8338098.1 rhodanese-like domain-containing protein [Draconibacterium sp. IB214405]
MKKIGVVILMMMGVVTVLSAQEKKVYDGYKELVAAVKQEIATVEIEGMHEKYMEGLKSRKPDYILIDVRTKDEYEAGHIPGAYLVQRGVLESHIAKETVWEDFHHALPKKTDTIILYCRSGSRSALATKSLMMLGYEHVYSLDGGWNAWHEDYPKLERL